MLKICQFIIQSITKPQIRISSCTQKRYISHTQFLNKKIYLDTENRFAHQILENIPNYNVFRLKTYSLNEFPTSIDINLDYFAEKNWSEQSSDEILNFFKTLITYCKQTETCISNNKFDSFIDAFTVKCFEFTDDQLIEALKILIHLPECPAATTRNFIECWNALDDNCVERLKDWSFEYALYVCDLWYQLKLAKINTFNWNAIRKIGRKVRKLTPQQLVQAMFYCNLLREPMIEVYDFEHNLIKCIDQLSLNEIGVMSMGFFKTQTSIKSHELLEIMFAKLRNEIETVPDITCVNILKILRYSSRPNVEWAITALLDSATSQVPRFTLLTCLHLALMGTDIQLCHPKCLEKIIERFYPEIDRARLKDMERISFVIGLHDFETESGIERDLFAKILAELKMRIPEITAHPRCFTSCLHYLTMKGYADEELISSALNQDFLKLAYGKNPLFGRDIFCLDAHTRINMKDTYSGAQLLDKQRQRMGKHLTNYLPDRSGKYRLSATDTFLLEINDAVKVSYQHCYMFHALPHHERADNIIAYNRVTDETVDISANIPTGHPFEILTKDVLLKDCQNVANLEVVNFVIGGRNNFVRHQDRPTGLMKMKLDQSRLMGLRPILVSQILFVFAKYIYSLLCKKGFSTRFYKLFDISHSCHVIHRAKAVGMRLVGFLGQI